MHRSLLQACAMLACAMLAATAGLADPPTDPAPAPAPPPIPVDLIERERVRLVLIDVLVLDSDGNTVPGLTQDDFEVVAGSEARPVGTLDVNCAPVALDEPLGVRSPGLRPVPAAGPAGRRIVLVFDYPHLYGLQRVDVLEQAQKLFASPATEHDEFMVAALTGGLRIEQPFTRDRETVRATLERMEYDITLWNGNFHHLSEAGFTGGMQSLLEVLGEYPGSKAVVLFSAMKDVPLDSQFRALAAAAAVSRCSLYPIDAEGLTTPTGPANVPTATLERPG